MPMSPDFKGLAGPLPTHSGVFKGRLLPPLGSPPPHFHSARFLPPLEGNTSSTPGLVRDGAQSHSLTPPPCFSHRSEDHDVGGFCWDSPLSSALRFFSPRYNRIKPLPRFPTLPPPHLTIFLSSLCSRRFSVEVRRLETDWFF